MRLEASVVSWARRVATRLLLLISPEPMQKPLAHALVGGGAEVWSTRERLLVFDQLSVRFARCRLSHERTARVVPRSASIAAPNTAHERFPQSELTIGLARGCRNIGAVWRV